MDKRSTQGKIHSHSNLSKQLRRMILTALFVALGASVKSFTKLSLSFFGAGGMQISFGGIFTFFPAALFGPIWGGIATALADVIGCIVAPTGAYIPWLTVTAFLTGFLKGVLWKLFTASFIKRARIPAAIFCVCLALLGGSFGASLSADGILPAGKFITAKEDLPERWQLEETEGPHYFALSRLTLSMAQYYKDTYTLKAIPADAVTNDTVTLPSAVYNTQNGVTVKPTKCTASLPEGVTKLVVPESYKTYPQADGVSVEIVKEATETQPSSDGWQVSSSDTYRKYLSGYVNFVFAGLLFIALCGLLLIGLDALLSRLDGTHIADYIRIALSITIAGSIATTINTFILRAYTPAWTGRVFLFIWIPRLIEEWIVCLLQAYAIAILWGICTRGRLKTVFQKVLHESD